MHVRIFEQTLELAQLIIVVVEIDL